MTEDDFPIYYYQFSFRLEDTSVLSDYSYADKLLECLKTYREPEYFKIKNISLAKDSGCLYEK